MKRWIRDVQLTFPPQTMNHLRGYDSDLLAYRAELRMLHAPDDVVSD